MNFTPHFTLLPQLSSWAVFDQAAVRTQSGIYPLEMVLWEIAARKTEAFDNVSDDFIIVSVQRGQRETICDGTPSDYVETIKRCLYLNPSERYIWKDDIYKLEELEDLYIEKTTTTRCDAISREKKLRQCTRSCSTSALSLVVPVLNINRLTFII